MSALEKQFVQCWSFEEKTTRTCDEKKKKKLPLKFLMTIVEMNDNKKKQNFCSGNSTMLERWDHRECDRHQQGAILTMLSCNQNVKIVTAEQLEPAQSPTSTFLQNRFIDDRANVHMATMTGTRQLVRFETPILNRPLAHRGAWHLSCSN